MTHDDEFDGYLRRGLATLAREAVPDDAPHMAKLPTVVAARESAPRRVPTRVLAAVVALAVALGGALAAALVLRGRDVSRPERPGSVWTDVARAPLLARSAQVAVFTGREVIVWGGRSDAAGNVAAGSRSLPGSPRYALADGAAYDVANDRWKVLPAAPIAGRFDAVAAWTGSEMLVVGGMRDSAGPGGGTGFLRDGAAYDPSHRRWRRIPDAPGCPSFGAWTGQQLVVDGACSDTPGAAFVTAAFDPRLNRWTTLPSFANARQLIVADGQLFAWDEGVSGLIGHGAVLDPHARRWLPLPALPRGSRLDSFAATYSGRLAVAGLRQDPGTAGPDRATVDLLDPNTRTWLHFESDTVGPPLGGSVVVGARGALVWSYSAGSLGSFFSVSSATSSALGAAFSNLGGAPVPLDRTGASLVAIGDRRFFVWGGRLAGNEHDQTNYPAADGAIVLLP